MTKEESFGKIIFADAPKGTNPEGTNPEGTNPEGTNPKGTTSWTDTRAGPASGSA